MAASTSTERIDETKDLPPTKLINTNLISLKCLIFFFFGGIGCLFPFLPLHMVEVGLSIEEIRLISMISPAIAMLGPLIAGPIADRLAGRQGKSEKASTGRHLRVMIAICCIFSALFYSVLLLVPIVNKVEISRARMPEVKFSCDKAGAIVQQERCKNRVGCHRWSDETRIGSMLLENCNYACYPIGAPRRWHPEFRDQTAEVIEPTDNTDGSGDITVGPLESELEVRAPDSRKTRRYVIAESEPPHLCFNQNDNVVCHVYTEYSASLPVNASLAKAINSDDKEEWCAYPVTQYFSCRIPPELEARMAEFHQSCLIECDLTDPYTHTDSILTESQCEYVPDNSNFTFWMYVIVRSIADLFPTTAVVLVDAAIVIATRETSCGRGDVGRQLAFGSLGFAIFGPLTGYLETLVQNEHPPHYIPICLHAMIMLFAAVIALSASGMPLSPPEWWWHTKSGMLALPMSAIKRYGCEIVALVFVLIAMGTCWSAMETYLPLHLLKLGGDELSIGVAMTVGAAPAFLFLWKSESLVDYCGHSNLLITAFTVYILRFTGLSLVAWPWYSLISEALELFTLGIMWVTAVLYFRHLVPRHLTVTAQALPVIAHFCIGRCIGAVIGAYVTVADGDVVSSLRFVYRCMAGAAAITAVLYFILYHGLLKPRCHAQTVQGTRQPPTIVQAAIREYEATMNGNGNYTPLRVYHNEMAKKGQFRY
ncbi:uncharacterized protein SP1173 [Prorops nasuta]|uniref:uncharacterized protein SP1173 n=1 Tax=Prorops nasuta TaxID=863751 RepID=UPI0034CF31C6